MVRMGEEEHRVHIDNAYRAIGRYAVEFSELVRDLGSDVGLAVYHLRGRPVGSSGFVEIRSAAIGIWKEGLCERITLYTRHRRGPRRRRTARRGAGVGGVTGER